MPRDKAYKLPLCLIVRRSNLCNIQKRRQKEPCLAPVLRGRVYNGGDACSGAVVLSNREDAVTYTVSAWWAMLRRCYAEGVMEHALVKVTHLMLSGQLIRKREAVLIPYSSEKALYCGMDGACSPPGCGILSVSSVTAVAVTLAHIPLSVILQISLPISSNKLQWLRNSTERWNSTRADTTWIHTCAQMQEIAFVFLLFALTLDYTQMPTKFNFFICNGYDVSPDTNHQHLFISSSLTAAKNS
ncbi:hypothetical protein PROFUN_00302 [Planoprotostelium fungivorum]|uniref:Uncharacterized protein n=1 Tax=Planoprotostelium fungivorum TaxID=1890364 RepID=A0A2P6NXZ9_9EUKA|nr:hypothetical protein PROFUN_00302 [Planoprotostelium fungivorum]